MRFITEFVLTPPNIQARVYAHKAKAKFELAHLIEDSFGWDERGETTIEGPAEERFKLEIEAFPMDKWEEFKNQLLREVDLSSADSDYVRLLLITLESFGAKKEPL